MLKVYCPISLISVIERYLLWKIISVSILSFFITHARPSTLIGTINDLFFLLADDSLTKDIETDSGLFGREDFDTLVEDCKLLVKFSKLPVKAAGGIKTIDQVQTLIKLGVSKIGTSNAVEIVTSDVNI